MVLVSDIVFEVSKDEAAHDEEETNTYRTVDLPVRGEERTNKDPPRSRVAERHFESD